VEIRKRALQWLSSDSFTMIHERIAAERVPNSGGWVSKTIQKWRTDPHTDSMLLFTGPRMPLDLVSNLKPVVGNPS